MALKALKKPDEMQLFYNPFTTKKKVFEFGN